MRRLQLVHAILLALLVAAAAPGLARAQNAIAGTVTDSTGGTLPGVTVEVKSPALIEQMRSTVTDSNGQYRFVDLRPGAYSLSFTLPGFSTIVRDRVELLGSATANIDAQMRVGALEETITVSGAAPVVDVQTTQQREVLNRDLVNSLPLGRSHYMVAAAVPSVDVGQFDVGGIGSTNQRFATAYGGGTQLAMMDGMKVDSGSGDGSIPNVYFNDAAVEEYVFQVNGGAAEDQSGGVKINMIPRSGGNVYKGQGVTLWANSALQSQNASAAQLTAGMRAKPEVAQTYDYSLAFGGPLKRDKLWFFTAPRQWTANLRLNLTHDGKMGPAGEQVEDRNKNQAWTTRLTWQATSKHKFTGMYEWAPKYEGFNNIQSLNRQPEATALADSTRFGTWVGQAKWTYTASNKVLVEGGWSGVDRIYKGVKQDVVKTPSELPPYGDIPKFDEITGRFYNAFEGGWYSPVYRSHTSGSASYISGAHALKTGVQHTWGYAESNLTSPTGFIQRYRAGVPFAVDIQLVPAHYHNSIDLDLGLFVQDSWTFKRLTLNPGIRWDKFIGSLPEQSMGAGRFFPARTYPAVKNLPNWSNWSPRFGAAYDLFGSGKTAVKGSWGKYIAREGAGFPGRYNPSLGTQTASQSDRRDWTDLNRNDIAEPNEIGPTRNAAFGLRANRNPSPDLTRSFDYLYSLSVNQELRSGLGMTVSYNRRESKNPTWTDDLAYSSSDYQLLTAADPRGNGQTIPVWQVIPGRVAPTNQLDQNTDANTRVFNGVDVLLHARTRNGFTISGGTSTGRLITKACVVENPNLLRFCDLSQYDIPFTTNLKLFGAVPLPWYGMRVGMVFQSRPGADQPLNYTVTRAQAPALSTVSSVSVRLNDPGKDYFDRQAQLDIQLSGVLKTGKVRIKPQIDVFNVLNANSVISATNQFPAQGAPLDIQWGRLARLGLQIDF